MLQKNVTKRASKTIVELDAIHEMLSEQMFNGEPPDKNELYKIFDHIDAAIKLQIEMLMQDNQVNEI